jgi:predicted transcriptional regulator
MNQVEFMHNETTPSMPAPFTVRLDESTLNALDHLAEKTERSRNWLVARAVEDFVALNAWQLGKIEAGIAAANRGEFASDEELTRVREKFAPKP